MSSWETEPLVAVPISTSFNCIAWDQFGEDGAYPEGLIAAGLSDGTLGFFDANALITETKRFKKDPSSFNGEENLGCVSMLSLQDDSAIFSLEFNPHKPGLLAAGGTELLILNVEKDVESPDSYKAGEPNPHADQTITSVSWNRKVSHILASSSTNGTLAVWDLKTRKPIFNISDKQPHLPDRATSLCWSPDQPTQFAACFDNDQSREIQLWDLRNMTGPFQALRGVHKGAVHQISWSELNPEIIWSGDRQKKLVAWEFKTGRVIFEKETEEEILDLRLSKRIKGGVCWSSTEGNLDLGILNLSRPEEDAALETTVSKSVWVPKWEKCPSTSSFDGKGGLAATWEGQNDEVSLWKVGVAETEETRGIEGVVEILEGGKSFMEKCEEMSRRKVAESNEGMGKVWEYLKSIDMNSDEKLALLGFSHEEIVTKTEKITGKKHSVAQALPKDDHTVVIPAPTTEFAALNLNEAEDFFNKAATTELPVFGNQKGSDFLVHSSNGPSSQKNIELSSDPNQHLTTVSTTLNTNWDAGLESLAKQNVLVGNIEGAVDCLMKLGRTSEAMVLAHSCSPALLESTINSYLLTSQDFFMKQIVSPLSKKQWTELASQYTLEQWREIAALAIVSHESKDFLCYRGEHGTVGRVLEIIGSRLQERLKETGEGWEEILQVQLLAKDGQGLKKTLSAMYGLFKRERNQRGIWDIVELSAVLAEKMGLNGSLGTEEAGILMISDAVAECVKLGFNFLGYRLASLFIAGDRRGKLANIRHRLWYTSASIQEVCDCPEVPYSTAPIRFPSTTQAADKTGQGPSQRQHGRPGPSAPIFSSPPSQTPAMTLEKTISQSLAAPPTVTVPPSRPGQPPLRKPVVVAPPPIIHSPQSQQTVPVNQPPPVYSQTTQTPQIPSAPPKRTTPVPTLPTPPLPTPPKPQEHLQSYPAATAQALHSVSSESPSQLKYSSPNDSHFSHSTQPHETAPLKPNPAALPQPMKPGALVGRGPAPRPGGPVIRPPPPVVSNPQRTPVAHPPSLQVHSPPKNPTEAFSSQVPPQVQRSIPSNVSSFVDYLKGAADSIRSFERDPRKINEIKKGVLLLVDQLNSETLKPEINELVCKIIQNLMVGDSNSASILVSNLLQIDYAENSSWMNSLRRLVNRRY